MDWRLMVRVVISIFNHKWIHYQFKRGMRSAESSSASLSHIGKDRRDRTLAKDRRDRIQPYCKRDRTLGKIDAIASNHTPNAIALQFSSTRQTSSDLQVQESDALAPWQFQSTLHNDFYILHGFLISFSISSTTW